MLTDQQHPLTPPPELVQQWLQEHYSALPVSGVTPSESALYIATQAARWGADTELNECCHLLRQQGFDVIEDLRAARRPKPRSLAEQGQRILVENGRTLDGRAELDPEDVVTLSAALERLQELESNG